MATLALRVNQGPGTINLSNIFKAATVDPDLAIKAAVAKANIWGQEHQNQLWDASAEEKRQLALKAAQEQADLKAKADAISGGVDPIAKMYQEQITRPRPTDQPVPVDVARIAGPVNGVPVTAAPIPVTPEQMTRYDAEVAAQPAIVRNILYGGGNAAQVAAGIYRGVGGAGMLEPSDPESARRHAILATGALPTKDTVIQEGDFAGVNAATKGALDVERGKAAIAAQTGEVKEVNGVLGRVIGGVFTPIAGAPRQSIFGNDDLARAREIVAEIDGRGGPRTDRERADYQLAQAAVAKNDLINVPEKSRLLQIKQGNAGEVETVPGSEAPGAGAPSSAYSSGTGREPIELGHLDEVSAKIESDPGYKPTRLEYGDYETMFTSQFLAPKPIQGTGPNKEPKIYWLYNPKPASVLTPAQVKARMMGLPIPPAEPLVLLPPPADAGATAAGGAAAAGTPAAAGALATPPVVEQTLGPGPEYVGTEAQLKDQRLLGVLVDGFDGLRKTPPVDLPDSFWSVMATPGTDPTVFSTAVARLAPGPARNYAQRVAQFALNLYSLSGSAFGQGERPRNIEAFIPNAADDAQGRKQKLNAMALLLQGIQNGAYAGNPEGRHGFQADTLKRFGVKFDDSAYAPEVQDLFDESGAPTNIPPMPANLKDVGGDPALWNDGYNDDDRAFFLERATKAAGQ